MTEHTRPTDRTMIVNKLTPLLESCDELIAAYLFGSVAQQKAHRQSDVDVALLFASTFDKAERFARTLAIGSMLETAVTPLDVVALNAAPLVLQFKILQSGLLLVDHDPTARCLFQMRVMSRYYDAKPFFRYHQDAAIQRIQQEGLGHGYHGHRNALAEARRLRATLAATASSVAG